MEFNAELFGARLKELRQEKELTTVELGQKLGYSDATISRWENGLVHPSIVSLYRIVTFFGTSAGYLLGTED